MTTLKTVCTLFNGHIIIAIERQLPLGGFDVIIDGKGYSGPFNEPSEGIEDAKKAILTICPKKFTHEKVN